MFAYSRGGWREIYGTLRREFIVYLIYLRLWTPQQHSRRQISRETGRMGRSNISSSGKVEERENNAGNTLECDCNINFGLSHSPFIQHIPCAILCNHFSILSAHLNYHLETANCGFYAFARLKIFHLIHIHHINAARPIFTLNTNNRIILERNGTCVTNFVCIYCKMVDRKMEWEGRWILTRVKQRMPSDLLKHMKVINCHMHIQKRLLHLKLISYLRLHSKPQRSKNSF